MRQLLPEPVDPVDPLEVYPDLPVVESRPSVRLNMVASVDGATTVAGRSGGLGGAGDKRLFAVLRSLADVVLVAADTVRTERYGPAPVPIAVVTRSCHLDWQAPFFAAAAARPIVVTVAEAPAENRSRAAQVADVVIAGEGNVDLSRALSALGEHGARQVLAEGGPTLNGQLARAGLIDELCLTLSPQLVGGGSKRIVVGDDMAAPTGLQLRSVCEEDDFLFLRFRRRGEGPA
jgi:riboflavin biosynthesis pyrimidine reductase